MFDKTLLRALKPLRSEDASMCLADMERVATKRLAARLGTSRRAGSRTSRSRQSVAQERQATGREETPDGGRSMRSTPTALSAKESEGGDTEVESRRRLSVPRPDEARRRSGVAEEGGRGRSAQQGRREDGRGASVRTLGEETEGGGQSSRPDSAVFGRGSSRLRGIDQADLQQRRTQEELQMLHDTVPDLLAKRQFEDAEKLVRFYLDKFPQVADLYVVFAEVYIHQEKYDRAIELYWGALFCVPQNRSIVRYLRAAEELYLQQVTRIPHRFKSCLFEPAEAGGNIRESEGSGGRDALRMDGRGGYDSGRGDHHPLGGRDTKSFLSPSASPTNGPTNLSPVIPAQKTSRFSFRHVPRHGATQPEDAYGGSRRRTSLYESSSSDRRRRTSAGEGAEWSVARRQGDEAGADRLPYIVVRQGKQAACIAEVALEPGQLVCRQLPYVSTPLLFEGGEIFTTCFHCLRERPVPDRGFSCPVSPHTCPFVFCSWDCLMRNVRVHATECGLMPIFMAAAREANLSVASVLHVCRFLIKSGLDRQVLPPRKDTLFKAGEELQSYAESVRIGQPELYKQLTLLARRIEKEFPPAFYCFLTRRELIDIMLILNQYSPFIRSAGPAAAIQRRRHPDISVGMVFSPALANFHHSCVPTCCFSLDDDGYVSVRAICHIPVGGRLCVSMVEDLFLPTVARKGVDALPRVFGCGCVRCTDPTEGGRLVRGIRCVNCLRGYCSPFKSRALQRRLQAYGVGGAEVARKIRNLENVRRSLEAGRAGGVTAAEGGQILLRDRGASRLGGGSNLFRFSVKRRDGGREELLSGLRAHNNPSADEDEGDEDLGSKHGSLQVIDELWQCNSCANSSEYLSTHCERLETVAASLVRKAEKKLARGEKLRARKIFLELIKRFGSLLHPNNHILFNAHVMAAGLLYSNPGQDVPQALVYIRRAVMAAEAVLPICHREKIFLHSRLAEITFSASIVEKLTNRGASPPPQFILEPMYTSLWNAVVCCGKESVLALTVRQQLRIYAAALGCATPPSLMSYKLVTLNVFLDYYRRIFGRKTDSDEIIRGIVENDPFKMAAAIARRGFHCPLSLEILSVFRDVHHLASGLSIMAIAASQTRVSLVKKLLEADFDFLRGNELGVTPLLAMAAMPLLRTAGLSPTEEDALREEQLSRTSSSSSSSLKKHGERGGGKDPCSFLTTGTQESNSDLSRARDEVDQDQAEIVRLFVRQCLRIDKNTKYNRAKDELFKACTHSILGRNGPLHYAAARGKKELCRQLLRNGCSARAQNAEGATPLHLACVSGDVETVHELLRAGGTGGRFGSSRERREEGKDGSADGGGQQGSGNKGRVEGDGRQGGERESVLLSSYLDSKTDRGETPLMLAAYGLQTEVVRLLLHRGADPNVVGQREQMTVLHALAVGVCRNFDVQYEALDLREHQAATMVMGMNSPTLATNIYNKSPTYLHVTDFIDARIPVVSRSAPDLLIFPQEILRRLKRANAIGEMLVHYCDRAAYTRQLKSGYSPSQLLAHLWERLFLLRNEVLGQSELRLAALTDRERQDIEAGWKCAAQLAFRLVELLKPDTILDGVERDDVNVEAEEDGDRTPRKEDLAERRRRQLEREAPWVIWEDMYKNQPEGNVGGKGVPSKVGADTPQAKEGAGFSKESAPAGGKDAGPGGGPANSDAEGKQDGGKSEGGAPPPPAGQKKGPPPPPGGTKKGPPAPPGGTEKGPLPSPGGTKKGPPPPPGGTKKGPPPPSGEGKKGPPAKKPGEEGSGPAVSGGDEASPGKKGLPPPAKKKGPPGLGKKGAPPPPKK